MFEIVLRVQIGNEPSLNRSLQHFDHAHTESGIYVHFHKANVISMRDTFFNGMYPDIDPGMDGITD